MSVMEALAFKVRPEAWVNLGMYSAAWCVGAASSGLRKKCSPGRGLTAAAKADAEKKPVIAAENRWATQNQPQRRVFPQPACGLSQNIR